jgi:Arrestin (or S-antigen), N-terminal domain
MIFNKLLKGTDLKFDISLEKTEFCPGEIVRGVLVLKAKNLTRARELKLVALGEESTKITESHSSGGGSSSSNTTTYTEDNTFFSENLSNSLRGSVITKVSEDGSLVIPPQVSNAAFEFILPSSSSLFSSYKGRHANITYSIKATVDIAKRLDVNKSEAFFIFNPDNSEATPNEIDTSPPSMFGNMTSTVSQNVESEAKHDPSLVKQREEGSIDKESYSSRFERIFGRETGHTPSLGRPYFNMRSVPYSFFDLQAHFAKDRDDFLKECSAKIILQLLENNKGAIYSRGQKLEGEVMLQESEAKGTKNIRGMKITLSGIEHAFAQGLHRISTTEKFEKDIKLNHNEVIGDSGKTIPFDFKIPNDVNQSYRGKYSEYYWGVEASVNVAWSSDIKARTIIEIV